MNVLFHHSINKGKNKVFAELKDKIEGDFDVYVWMEGCDYDCNSTSVKLITEKSVTATLGFCVGAAT